MILLLVASHLVWGCALGGLWAFGSLLPKHRLWWDILFVALQLYFSAQLLLPVLLMHPERRNRGFYLFWAVALALSVLFVNQLVATGIGGALLQVAKSGLLMLVATITGAAMARYVKRLWEVVPVCLVMTLADFGSWLHGPTSQFARQIQQYYTSPQGPPPLVDMVLIKLSLPGASGLVPVFGISDWIMVVFFAIVAGRHNVNDNLVGPSGEVLAKRGRIGSYLPVSVVALLLAILLAQATGLFIPALPVIALIMVAWYSCRYLYIKL